MGEALIKGLLVSGRLGASQLQVSDISSDRLKYLESNYQVSTVANNSELTRTADIVVIAVKPQQMVDVLTEINSNLDHLPLMISIAAGVPLIHLQQKLDKPVPLVRAMPNTPALVLAGISAISAGAHATPDHMNIARVLSAWRSSSFGMTTAKSSLSWYFCSSISMIAAVSSTSSISSTLTVI